MNIEPSEEHVVRLFAQEIPQIAAGVVEIKAVARKAGLRTKVALYSPDPKVDAVGCCVGVRGCRIRKIVDQLGMERIDLMRWDDSPERLIVNALQPARVEKVILQHAQHRAVVVVTADQASLVEGRRGLNRELASRLSGWQIQVRVE
jgi:N utilization substance protein A